VNVLGRPSHFPSITGVKAFSFSAGGISRTYIPLLNSPKNQISNFFYGKNKKNEHNLFFQKQIVLLEHFFFEGIAEF